MGLLPYRGAPKGSVLIINKLMNPISNYKELIQTLNWDEEKRNNERWYIFLVMNPSNQTNAGIDIIKNLVHLRILLIFYFQ